MRGWSAATPTRFAGDTPSDSREPASRSDADDGAHTMAPVRPAKKGDDLQVDHARTNGLGDAGAEQKRRRKVEEGGPLCLAGGHASRLPSRSSWRRRENR